jgi:hypothetical protein
MGSKTNRKSKNSKVSEVEHVDEVEKKESAIEVTTGESTLLEVADDRTLNYQQAKSS